MSGPIREMSGRLRSVWWADQDAKNSFSDALATCPSAKQQSITLRFVALMEKIANEPIYGRTGIQKNSFPWEGRLPGLPGKPGGKYYAIKKVPVRAYGWFYEGEDHPEISKDDFIISHCISKDSKKKKSVEDTRIANKWRALE